MTRGSTNQNFLMLLGMGEATLYEASRLFDLNPQGVVLTSHIVRGAALLGPKGSDPTHCVVLTQGAGIPDSWALIDYRHAISDAELEQGKAELLNQLPYNVQQLVRVDSTQDLSFRETALR